MTTNPSELYSAIIDTVEGSVHDMKSSTEILDPSGVPQTILNKCFSVELDSYNAAKDRDAPGGRMRIEEECVVRMAFRLNPKGQSLTYRNAMGDEESVIIAIMNDLRSPLQILRTRYIRSRRFLNPNRDWLFIETYFGFEYNMSLED